MNALGIFLLDLKQQLSHDLMVQPTAMSTPSTNCALQKSFLRKNEKRLLTIEAFAASDYIVLSHAAIASTMSVAQGTDISGTFRCDNGGKLAASIRKRSLDVKLRHRTC